MFLILIILAAVLLFVLFAKRPVNTAGLAATWTAPILPPDPPKAPKAGEAAPPAPVAPVVVDTMNFNDIFGGKPAAKPAPTNDQPPV